MQDLKGMQIGNHLYINARNAKTIEDIAKTIIHEETHLEYDVYGSQWAEVFCDLKEELHVKGEVSMLILEVLLSQSRRDILNIRGG